MADMDVNHGLQMQPGNCAACRHLRRMCEVGCIFAPYFPAQRAEEFQVVQRIFGVRNVENILNSVEDNERDRTVETLIMEARIRLQDPINGCLGIEMRLRAEIEQLTKELNEVQQQLQFFMGGGRGAAPPPPYCGGASGSGR